MKIGFRVLEVPWRNGIIRQVEQGFSSFFAKFLPYMMMIFQRSAMLHFGKSSSMAKIWQKMKKSLVQIALYPFIGWFRGPENPISGTRSVNKTNRSNFEVADGLIYYIYYKIFSRFSAGKIFRHLVPNYLEKILKVRLSRWNNWSTLSTLGLTYDSSITFSDSTDDLGEIRCSINTPVHTLPLDWYSTLAKKKSMMRNFLVEL